MKEEAPGAARAPTAAARPQAGTAGFLASAAVPAQADAGPVATGASTTGASRSGVSISGASNVDAPVSGVRAESLSAPNTASTGHRAAAPRLRLRLARNDKSDYRAALALAREFHGRTMFRDSPFSEAKARRLFERAVAQPERYGLVLAERWGRADGAAGGLVGFAYVQAGEYFLAERDLLATVLALVTRQEIAGTPLGGRAALRLVAALRQWARERACKHVLVHATGGIEPARTDRFFRRCGFKVVGGNYVEQR
ncbi:N-acetyltransferase family protein [Stappia sp.]|uniref:GNAT family N-acetyltransferase n=1 Tax=Stappia sp. TaxID=1870903 RepID=UPI003C79AE43